MNKHLIDFINDEIKTNNYYKPLRDFATGKDWDSAILSPIIDAYGERLDDFGPYRFIDAVADFLSAHPKKAAAAADLWEIIDEMDDAGAFCAY